MSIGCLEEEQDKFVHSTITEPLKIPQPKNAMKFAVLNNSAQDNTNTIATTISTSTTSTSFSLSAKNKLHLKCDSPQIFSIESRAESRIDGLMRVNNVEVPVNCPVDGSGDANKKEGNSGSFHTIKNAVNTSEFGGYRDVGASSGFNSDLDSDSPFYSSDIDSDASSEPPILWNFADYFASLPGNDWCVRIPQCFIDDEFNLFEFPDVFSCPLTLTDEASVSEKEEFTEYAFDDLIDFITIEDLTEDPIPKISKEMLEDSVLLYKLIHQRFIMTKAGLQAMWEKFENQTFGTCPRYFCHVQPLLPVGPSALPGKESVKVYCLNCQDLYEPLTQRHAKMDGVPFGPSFAHFFVRTVLYGNQTKALENRSGPHDWQVYVPKIYGFKIYKPDADEEPGIRSERLYDFK